MRLHNTKTGLAVLAVAAMTATSCQAQTDHAAAPAQLKPDDSGSRPEAGPRATRSESRQPPTPKPDHAAVQAQETVHVVAPGESLAAIAGNFDTTWRRLFNANPQIEHPDIITAGTELRIPRPGEELDKRPLPKPVVKMRTAARHAGGGIWAALRQCESGGDYTINTGNGYYGAYQFSLQTWRSLGYGGYPHQASPAVQDEAARRLQARSGWGQWPACSRKLGLR